MSNRSDLGDSAFQGQEVSRLIQAGQGELPFLFDKRSLLHLADQLHEEFQQASPFKHVVIDDFLPGAILERVLEEYPEPEEVPWQVFDTDREVKLALADVTLMGPITRHLLAEFNGQVFIEFLERLTGIEGLVPDPHYLGGGLHQIRRGGLLKVHADFNRHPRLRLDRRLNGLLYLNKDWPESFGGHLELWNAEMTQCVRRIAPVFNRFVLFATTDDANHGHPDPLLCPPDRARRSLALYYYSNGRPEEEQRPDHTTVFKTRPGESWDAGAREVVRRWLPPALLDWSRRVWSRR